MYSSLQKWIMLLLYSYLQFIGGSVWITFASIFDSSKKYYSTSSFLLNLFSLSFLIMQLPMAPLSSYIFRKSYYYTIMLAFFLTTLGVWIRFLAGKSVGLALFGQILVGAMSSLTLSGCAVLSNLWFEPEHQSIAVAIASMSNLLGAAYGLVISPYFPSIPVLLLVQACYTSVGFVLNIIFSRKQTNSSIEIENFAMDVKIAFTDKYLLGIILLISSLIGIAYAVTGIIYQLFNTFGVSESESGWIGFSMYIGGAIGGLLTSILVMKTDSFVNPIRIFLGISLVGLIMWSVYPKDIYTNIIGSCICGFGLFGLMPLGIQAAAKQNKHIPESITANLIYLISQGISVIYTYPMIFCYEGTGISGIWIGTLIAFISATILLVIYRKHFVEKYKTINESIAVSLKSFMSPNDSEQDIN